MDQNLIKTGIPEFDDILGGGLTPNRVYLLHGTPGAGKTTLSLQFLLEGVKNGERTLYITLSETKEELLAVAKTHGFSLDKINIFELIADESELYPENQYTMYQPSEVELSVTTKAILEEFDRVRPSRMIIDSLSEIKLMAQSSLRYRRQVMALKQFFIGRECTVIFIDDKSQMSEGELQLESTVHGVINLDQICPEYGAERRRIYVTKLRGQRYRGGYHDFTIVRGGLSVFPRLIAAEHEKNLAMTLMKSGVKEIDDLLGGGIETGTSTLLLGPAGVGKSSFSLHYAVEAARRGERSAFFIFDERIDTTMHRAAGMGMDLKDFISKGLITLESFNPAELSPGEFTQRVRNAVEGRDGNPPAKIVIIDSLNGYLNAMPEERSLICQLHELLTYLGHFGVVTFLIVAQHGLMGSSIHTPVDTSYLADSVILFRFFEADGEVKQLISVVKKRGGFHERKLREFKMDKTGIRVGVALSDFHGVLTGNPVYQGRPDDLLRKK